MKKLINRYKNAAIFSSAVVFLIFISLLYYQFRDRNTRNIISQQMEGLKQEKTQIMGEEAKKPEEPRSAKNVAVKEETREDEDRPKDAFEEKIFDLINRDRQKNGEEELKWSPELAESAKAKAKDMIEEDYFDHTSPEGESPWQEIKKTGYKFSYVGENLAFNYSSPEQTHQGLMNSEGHRENILSSDYTEVGISAIKGTIDGEDGYVVVEHFGRPA